MLNDATCFKEVNIVTGYTDLRSGIDRLAAFVKINNGGKPIEPNVIYLFCGRKVDRIKGLVWEGDVFLLVYKRLYENQFIWPRNEHEVRQITLQQFRWLMDGLTMYPKMSIKKGAVPQYMA